MKHIALHPRERAAFRAARALRRPLAWPKAILIALPIVAVISLSAQATFSAVASHEATPSVIAAVARATSIADESAPVLASPAQGTTGTIDLPPEPIDFPAPARFDTTIVAAQPFSTAHASAIDRGRALECLTAAIYYEAASEPDDGQRAVAQVVLNRVRHPAFPATVCGVVYQGSERASGCQFSFACDGALARVPSRTGWARAMRAAATALAGQVFAPVGLATHYHTYAVTPAWNRTLVMTDAIGAHFFHRWKGYWGTALAFRQTYNGGEPFPGPHAKLIQPAAPLVTIAVAATPAPGPVAQPNATPATPATFILPGHADSGTPIADPVGASQVLDRWKDSGKPIR